MRVGLAFINLVLLSSLVGIAGSCAVCAGAAYKVATIAARAASAPRPAPRPEPGGAFVWAEGDLGYSPEPAALGRGHGPPSGVRPPIPLWRWNHRGHHHGGHPHHHGGGRQR